MKFIARLFGTVVLSLLSISAVNSTELSGDTVARIDRYLKRAVENGYSGSVLLAVSGKVLLKQGYGFADSEHKVPFTADTIFDIGSITKQFTAACILKLETQRKLSTDDALTKFFVRFPKIKRESQFIIC